MTTAIDLLDDVDNFLESLVSDTESTLQLNFSSIEAVSMTIKLNHQQLSSITTCAKSTYQIDTYMELDHANLLEICSDKPIQINKLLIDNFDLLFEKEFYSTHLVGYNDTGLNSSITLNFSSPFVKWFSDNSNSNTVYKQDTHMLESGRESMDKLLEQINKLN